MAAAVRCSKLVSGCSWISEAGFRSWPARSFGSDRLPGPDCALGRGDFSDGYVYCFDTPLVDHVDLVVGSLPVARRHSNGGLSPILFEAGRALATTYMYNSIPAQCMPVIFSLLCGASGECSSAPRDTACTNPEHSPAASEHVPMMKMSYRRHSAKSVEKSISKVEICVILRETLGSKNTNKMQKTLLLPYKCVPL